jgi:hypothetical protein
MAINLRPGQLYFIGEFETDGTTKSPFTKIGLVYDDRAISERLRDHQTGNPREVFLERNKELGELAVPCMAISELESTMHAVWASNRLAGEWFALGEQIKTVFENAQAIALEIDSGAPFVQAAESFRDIVTTEKTRDIDSEVEDLWEIAKNEYLTEKFWKAKQGQHSSAIVREMKSSAGIDGVVRWKKNSRSRNFDTEMFEKKYKKIHDEFVVENKSFLAPPKWPSSAKPFSEFLAKNTLEVGDESSVSIPESFDENDIVARTESAIKAHAEWLKAFGNAQLANLRKELAFYRILAKAEDSGGFDGIVIRNLKIEQKFSKTACAEFHPEKIEECTKLGPEKKPTLDIRKAMIYSSDPDIRS